MKSSGISIYICCPTAFVEREDLRHMSAMDAMYSGSTFNFIWHEMMNGREFSMELGEFEFDIIQKFCKEYGREYVVVLESSSRASKKVTVKFLKDERVADFCERYHRFA